jgi:hypothetical protein
MVGADSMGERTRGTKAIADMGIPYRVLSITIHGAKFRKE